MPSNCDKAYASLRKPSRSHGHALMRDTVGIDSAYFAAFPRLLLLTAATDSPDHL